MRLVVFLVGLLLVLELFDVTALVGAILGTAGVLGIALGFAFKDIVENYLASVLLSLRQPFQKNDLISIEGQHEGKVVRLTLRETVLMTLDGNHVRVPNAVVFKSVVTNFTRNPLRRFRFSVGIGVDEDLAEAVRIGREALLATPGVLADPPPTVWIDELGESSVKVDHYAWFDQRTHLIFPVKSEAIHRVKAAFDAAGLDMPEPVIRVMDVPFSRKTRTESLPPETPPAVDVTAADGVDGQIALERLAPEEDLLTEES